ncbi:hypothetical protein JOB18_047515 [Solea senegalensis]|uniref:Uncharacterized protein n=1 Tax=Solea senegalensis TaxID=28829 RepID=A0AAV6Q2Y9_SOLSE|nr:hypothetical protein JOB18_047515 [Solea senegalensis]
MRHCCGRKLLPSAPSGGATGELRRLLLTIRFIMLLNGKLDLDVACAQDEVKSRGSSPSRRDVEYGDPFTVERVWN